nr:DUF4032 domain-containing protein [Methylacidiphilum caldifontis]
MNLRREVMEENKKMECISTLLKNSTLYQEFLLEREEILKHKWIESEKKGYDIGFEKALLDWVINHRSKWLASRRKNVD